MPRNCVKRKVFVVHKHYFDSSNLHYTNEQSEIYGISDKHCYKEKKVVPITDFESFPYNSYITQINTKSLNKKQMSSWNDRLYPYIWGRSGFVGFSIVELKLILAYSHFLLVVVIKM